MAGTSPAMTAFTGPGPYFTAIDRVMPLTRDFLTNVAVSGPHNIRGGEILALEQQPRAVRLGASIRQAIAKIEPGFGAPLAVALEGRHGDVRHVLGDRHDGSRAISEQPCHPQIDRRGSEFENG